MLNRVGIRHKVDEIPKEQINPALSRKSSSEENARVSAELLFLVKELPVFPQKTEQINVSGGAGVHKGRGGWLSGEGWRR